MKKTTRFLVGTALLTAALALTSCADALNNVSTTAGFNEDDTATTTTPNDGTSNKDSVNGTPTSSGTGGDGTVKNFGDNFIRGFDASAVDYWENDYAPTNTWADVNWYDDGTKTDFFTILVNHGFNTVRLRVWVDPSVTDTITNDSTWPTSTSVENAWRNGDTTLERTTKLAKRAKNAGLKVMLDMHLSDYWTDPAVQLIPKAWQDITTADSMAEKLTSYITQVLTYMKENDATPDFVQVGNEVDRGLLVDKQVTDASKKPKTTTKADSAISGEYSTTNFKTYLKAGCQAVRNFDPSIKIIVHMTNKNADRFSYVTASNADYDIVGLSYYPWEDHGTISKLKENISSFINADKDVMVVETSFPWQHEGTSDDLKRAATQLIDPKTSAIYADLVCASENTYIIADKDNDNQKKVIRHVMQEVFDSKGIGCCIWGGERRGDYDYALFDWNGNALEALDAFNYKPADGYTTEDGTDSTNAGDGDTDSNGDDKADGTAEETMTLTINFSGFTCTSNSYIAINYGYAEWKNLVYDKTISGSSMTISIEKKYCNDDGLVKIYINDRDKLWTGTENIAVEWDNATLSDGGTEFTYNSSGVTLTLKVKWTPYTATNLSTTSFAKSYTGTGEGVQFLTSSSFSGLSAGTILVVGTNGSGSGEWWLNGSADGNSYTGGYDSSNQDYRYSTTDITSLQSNGLYIKVASGISFTITVTYTPDGGGTSTDELPYSATDLATTAFTKTYTGSGTINFLKNESFTGLDDTGTVTITVSSNESGSITCGYDGLSSWLSITSGGSGASFTVSDIKEKWIKIYFEKDTTHTITVTYTAPSSSGGGNEVTFPYEISYTADGKLQKIIEDGVAFGEYTAITVEASNIVWSSESSDNYIGVCDSADSWTNKLDLWENGNDKKIDIKSGDSWSGTLYTGVKTSGLYVAASSGMTCTLKVSVWNQSD